jgi:hypothetical protein
MRCNICYKLKNGDTLALLLVAIIVSKLSYTSEGEVFFERLCYMIKIQKTSLQGIVK